MCKGPEAGMSLGSLRVALHMKGANIFQAFSTMPPLRKGLTNISY